MILICALYGQKYGDTFVWRWRPCSVSTWQSLVHTEIAISVCCGKTWLPSTDSWPQHHLIHLGWTWLPTVRQASSQNITGRPQFCFCSLMEANPCSQVPKCCRKLSIKSGGHYSSLIMAIVLEWNVQQPYMDVIVMCSHLHPILLTWFCTLNSLLPLLRVGNRNSSMRHGCIAKNAAIHVTVLIKWCLPVAYNESAVATSGWG